MQGRGVVSDHTSQLNLWNILHSSIEILPFHHFFNQNKLSVVRVTIILVALNHELEVMLERLIFHSSLADRLEIAYGFPQLFDFSLGHIFYDLDFVNNLEFLILCLIWSLSPLKLFLEVTEVKVGLYMFFTRFQVIIFIQILVRLSH